jgi:pimeloyl-ACP methyl ester carboxylesterase
MAAQYGRDSQAADAAATKRTLLRVSGRTIVVRHSYGRAAITAAGTDDRVVGLVYISAVAAHAGETVRSQLHKYPATIFGHINVAVGRVWMLPEDIKHFSGNLPDRQQKVVWANHFAPDADPSSPDVAIDPLFPPFTEDKLQALNQWFDY